MIDLGDSFMPIVNINLHFTLQEEINKFLSNNTIKMNLKTFKYPSLYNRT